MNPEGNSAVAAMQIGTPDVVTTPVVPKKNATQLPDLLQRMVSNGKIPTAEPATQTPEAPTAPATPDIDAPVLTPDQTAANTVITETATKGLTSGNAREALVAIARAAETRRAAKGGGEKERASAEGRLQQTLRDLQASEDPYQRALGFDFAKNLLRLEVSEVKQKQQELTAYKQQLESQTNPQAEVIAKVQAELSKCETELARLNTKVTETVRGRNESDVTNAEGRQIGDPIEDIARKLLGTDFAATISDRAEINDNPLGVIDKQLSRIAKEIKAEKKDKAKKMMSQAVLAGIDPSLQKDNDIKQVFEDIVAYYNNDKTNKERTADMLKVLGVGMSLLAILLTWLGLKNAADAEMK